MTFEERLSALGVDLSDLPKPTAYVYAYEFGLCLLAILLSGFIAYGGD